MPMAVRIQAGPRAHRLLTLRKNKAIPSSRPCHDVDTEHNKALRSHTEKCRTPPYNEFSVCPTQTRRMEDDLATIVVTRKSADATPGKDRGLKKNNAKMNEPDSTRDTTMFPMFLRESMEGPLLDPTRKNMHLDSQKKQLSVRAPSCNLTRTEKLVFQKFWKGRLRVSGPKIGEKNTKPTSPRFDGACPLSCRAWNTEEVAGAVNDWLTTYNARLEVQKTSHLKNMVFDRFFVDQFLMVVSSLPGRPHGPRRGVQQMLMTKKLFCLKKSSRNGPPSYTLSGQSSLPCSKLQLMKNIDLQPCE